MVLEEKQKTKKCKYCHSEINAEASKCPKCQGDLRSWFSRHFILSVVLGMVILVITATVASPSEKTSTTKRVGDVKVNASPTIGSKDQVYKIGDTVSVLDSEFVVNSVRRTRRIGYYEAKANKEYVVVTITLKNKSKDKDMSFSRTDFKVRNEQGIQDDYASASYRLDDDLTLDSLAAGGIVEGSMAFEVDRGAKLKFLYQPNFFMQDYRIVVDLGPEITN